MMASADLTPRAQVKRERIHRAAQALFMQQGFEATSMDAIAVAAAVSKPTLYRYYQNKEALFIAVLEQLALGHLSESALLALRDTPMDSLATLEHALIVWAQATIENIMQPVYVGLVRLLIAELPRFPRLGSLFAQAVPQQGGAFLKAMLESARSHGVIVEDDLELVIRLLAGPLLTYVLGDGLFAPDGIPQPPPPERVATLVQLVLQGIASHGQQESP
ncbi:MAG: TetR/AcrR family transcriptional regulator [Chloroflexi bacterium]|nr:MAG: TetR/AcrR family transcriptional regulator [Chloroflexota bacterium]